jgi:membrane glycosyltransferase
MLLAPIQMLFRARFVVTTLWGWGVSWRSRPRNDAETTWSEALRQRGTQTLIGLVWAAAVYSLNPGFLRWLLPVLGALIVAIPPSELRQGLSTAPRLRFAWTGVRAPRTARPALRRR